MQFKLLNRASKVFEGGMEQLPNLKSEGEKVVILERVSLKVK